MRAGPEGLRGGGIPSIMMVHAVGASAAPNWLNNEEHTTWQKFLIGFHRFVVHFLFGWLWMPWFNMLWYGGM